MASGPAVSSDFPTSLSFEAERQRQWMAGRTRTMRVVLVGAGSMAKEHIRVTNALGRARIHGLYDPFRKNVESALALLNGQEPPRCYASLQEACADPDAEAYIVATPNHTHRDVVAEVIGTGKPILLEKPMTTTVEDAAAVVEMTRGYPSVFMVGFEYRQKPVYIEALAEVFERRVIGDVKMIYIMEHRGPFYNKVRQWNKFAEYSGGTLVEKGCHFFDLFALFARSRPVKVYASGGTAVNFLDFEYEGRKSDIADHAFVLVDFANGVKACLNLCMFPRMRALEEMILNGDRGRMRIYDHPRSEIEIFREGAEYSRSEAVLIPPDILETGNHGGSSFFEHILFHDAIEGKDVAIPEVADGLWSVVIGVAGEESLRRGEPVQVDELLAERAPGLEI